MKNRIYKEITCCLLTMFSLLACVDLVEDTTGQPTPDKFFGTLTDFNSFISGAYAPITTMYGTDCPYVACAGGEDICVSSVVRWRGFEQADINSVNNPEEITDILWNNSYSSISACNTLISLIAGNTKLSSEQLSPIDGEARLLRALNYFNMVRWFGEIPILTEQNQSNAANEPQASIAAIYDQVISDLGIAEKKLPKTQTDKSRPTRYAAKALMAKVYLTMAGYPLNKTESYALARDKANEVITEGGYILEDDFSDLWLWQNRNTNTEFIFTLYASSNNGTGGYINRSVRPNEEKGWADWTSDQRFLAKFPVGDNSRVKGTFYLTFNADAGNISWQQAQVAEPYVGKLRDGGDKSGNYAGSAITNIADGFYPIIRYADVLLIYAEAANMAEGAPSTKAYDALNEVRLRAGLSSLSGLNNETFDKAVIDERNWELAFECNRWFDMCRRHIVADVISELYPSRTIDDHNYLLPKPSDQLAIMKGVRQNEKY